MKYSKSKRAITPSEIYATNAILGLSFFFLSRLKMERGNKINN
jgi:hypothetical protein